MSRRRLAACLLTVAVVCGCTGRGADVEPDDPPTSTVAPDEVPEASGGGTLRVALPGDPATLDPRFVADDEGELLVGALFEPLVRLGPGGAVLPGAATSWEVEDEGRTFTFTLREATFHDGQPVTADDFVRSFARIADATSEPPSFLGFLLAPVAGSGDAADGGELSGVEALDDATLRITLDDPHPRFLLTLADPSLVPVPATADDDLEGFGRAPVGNGPFALAEAPEPGGFVRLAAVADHHRRPSLDEVLFSIYPDDADRERQWQDLEEGLLQVAGLPPSRRAEAEERYGRSDDGRTGPGVIDGEASSVYVLGFDLTRAPYDDEVVRRALSQSLDRDRLVDEVFDGGAVAADRFLPPSLPASQAGSCDHCRTDPEGAAALLQDAGIDLEGAPPLVLTHNRSARHAAVAEQVAADVRAALGVEVEVEELPLSEYVPTVRRGDAPWFRLGWDANAPDPDAYLEPLFHSRNVGLDNLTRYADESTDELLDAGRAATTSVEAQTAYRDAERRVLDAVAVIPLVFERVDVVVTADVEGLVWDATGRVDLARVRLAEDG